MGDIRYTGFVTVGPGEKISPGSYKRVLSKRGRSSELNFRKINLATVWMKDCDET